MVSNWLVHDDSRSKVNLVSNEYIGLYQSEIAVKKDLNWYFFRVLGLRFMNIGAQNWIFSKLRIKSGFLVIFLNSDIFSTKNPEITVQLVSYCQ